MTDTLLGYVEFLGADAIVPIQAVTWWLGAGDISPENCMCAYQPALVPTSLAQSYINLNNPGVNDAQVGVAPTWDVKRGWIFNGSSQYLYSVPANGGNYTVIVLCTTSTANTSGRIFGTAVGSDSDPRLFFVPNSNSAAVYENGNGGINVGPAFTSGIVAIAGNKAYRNGVLESGTMTAWSGTNNNPIAIGAQKSDTGMVFARVTDVQAFAVYNITLTQDQIKAIGELMLISPTSQLHGNQVDVITGYLEVIHRVSIETDLVIAYAESLAGNDPRPVLGPRWQ